MGRLWRINYISAPASLAALPRARQKRLYDDFAARIAEDSLGTDWAAFRRNLVQLESERHPVSIGEVNKGNVGVAAAIPATQHGLVLVFSTGRYAVLDESLVRDEVIAAGGGGWRHAEDHARNGETGMAWHPVALQLLPALCVGAVAELTANWPMSPTQLCPLECQLFDPGAL